MSRYGKLVVAIIAFVLLIIMVTFSNKEEQPLEVNSAVAAEILLEPTKHDSGGVDADSAFIIKSPATLKAKEVEKSLRVEPSFDFTVTEAAGTGNELMLIPQETLQADQIYQFILPLKEQQSLKWAFQTKAKLKVLSTLPRDRFAGVPQDTGVEITFSHLNFASLSDYFTISPQVEG
ncbi:MAG: hypothetical protein MI740_17785, partial [Halanaerobiales bacterium]|nr:hypothetical protein [Halanaerobiales bacterium]